MRAMPWPANYDAGVIQGRLDEEFIIEGPIKR